MIIKKINIILLVLMAVLYSYVFYWMANEWLTNPYYSHGILIPLISGFIIYKKRIFKNLSELEEKYEPGMYIFIFGMILYVIGFIRAFLFISAISFLFTTTGIILYFYGKKVMESLSFPLYYLIFAMPMPFVFLGQIALGLQRIAILSSSFLISLFGLPVTTEGSEIQLQNYSFYVGLPCSGIYTLISLLALTTVFIYILDCHFKKKLFLFMITIPIAILANIIRVTLIILIANSYGLDVAMGFFHDFSSIILFIISFVFLIIIARLMKCKIGGIIYGKI